MKQRIHWTGIFAFLLVSPLYFLFVHAGRATLGKYVCMCVALHIVAIKMNWDLIRRPWFWGIIAASLAIQLPIIFSVHWPSSWTPAISIFPFAVADAGLILGAIALVERLNRFQKES